MIEDLNSEISDSERLRIVSDFILHSPPGEFNEVFNDIRVLLNNDNLLKDEGSAAFAQYDKDQFIPVEIDNSDLPVIISDHNDLGSGRFCDPRSKQSFKYDYLRRETSNYEQYEPPSALENLRSIIELEFLQYTQNHYKNGVCSVFSRIPSNNCTHINDSTSNGYIAICIEDHQFQPNNYWNGRWRSQWILQILGNGIFELKGILKVQVHYYEEGNVQLVSSKEVKESFQNENETQLARELVQFIEDAENHYQTSISENYQTMSDTTFKALRRQLPVTRTKIDWNKIVSYNIGKELVKP